MSWEELVLWVIHDESDLFDSSLFAYPMRMRQGPQRNALARRFFGGMRTDFTPKSPERLSSWAD